MTIQSIFVLILVCGTVWGGFFVALSIAIKSEKEKLSEKKI